MDLVLDFERPIVELKQRIASLRALEQEQGSDLSASISALESQAARLQQSIFDALTPWQRTLLSRHPARPYMDDCLRGWIDGWTELHGDRAGHDDQAIVGGVGFFRGRRVVVIGHQKGRNTKENVTRNFGMALPDGYRKALRLMNLAHRFGMPVITLIDTAGAFPGIDAEARGQAEAIARNIMEMSTFSVPIIAVVMGEGGSGGALALGIGNRVLMFEHAVYSVISPEGCAAILWHDRAEGPRAAEALRITAQDCLRFGVIDEIVPEPAGGAHRDVAAAIATLGDVVERHLAELEHLGPDALRADRYARFRRLGAIEAGA